MKHNTLTLGSLFSGSGAFELAGLLAGIQPIWSSEVAPFPIRVTTKRMPFVKHYGDISKLNGAMLEPVDIITFGSPCQDMSIAGKRAGLDGSRSSLFYQAIRIIQEMREKTNGEYPKYTVWENVCFVKGTLITTEYGYKPIEEIQIGDKVKTLSGRYMPVIKAYKTQRQEIIRIDTTGSEPIECTPNHPFLVKRRYTHKGHIKYCKSFNEPKWLRAGEISTDDLIGYVLDIPDDNINCPLTEDEAWAVGRWLADGSVDLTRGNPRIFISCGNKKIEPTRAHLSALPYNIHENRPHPTALNFVFTSWNFYKLIEPAGKLAGNKVVPPYVFKLPIHLQKAVLDGYISGDGYIRERHQNRELSANTASRRLAYGITRLIRNCYHVGASISVRKIKNGRIGDRVINANYPSYEIYAILQYNQSHSFVENGVLWQPIKSIERLPDKQSVYNLSVEEDNTYEANNIIVHNCGAFSSNQGEDFRCVLETFCKIKKADFIVPQCRKWRDAGLIMGGDFSVAWRIIDAQHFGVAQRRRRLFLVADFDGKCAGKILFESEGLSRYSPQSFRTWQAAAGYFADSVGTSSSYCLMDQGGIRMDVSLNKTGTLRAQANHPPCVLEEDVPKTLKIRSGCEGGGKGALIQENISATLATNNDQTLFVPKAYGVCAKHSNSMLSDNPNSGFYEAQTSRTIDTSNQSPNKNQGGIIVLEGNGSRPSHRGNGYKKSETMYTLNTVETHRICTEYLVRRLTPQECALLQGLPPWWCENLETENPTEKEVTYWQGIWNEWNALNGKKPKFRNQVLKWLQNPHSDAAEYMMYGNAICMSCGFFVLSGIAYFAENLDV